MKGNFKQISLRAKALIVLFVLLFAGVFALSMVYRSDVNAKYATIAENEEKIKTLRSGITTEILLLSLQVVLVFLADG